MLNFGTEQEVKNDRFWELEQYKNKLFFGNGKEQF